MPIIKISAADIQKIKTIDEGWYPARIVSVSELTKSAKGNSLNLTIGFLLTHNTDGKEIMQVFNSQLIGKIVPLVEACRGMDPGTIKSEDFELDTSEFLGKQVDVHVILAMYNNAPINNIDNFLVYGKGTSQKSAF